eukprot:3595664-Pyramimonas_sp.AAC.1
MHAQVVTCTSKVAYSNGARPVLDVPYDTLVVGVGEEPNTFNTPGVRVGARTAQEKPHETPSNPQALKYLPGPRGC